MPTLTNIGTLARCTPAGGQDALHEIHDAALTWTDDTITWVGPAAECPPEQATEPVIDAEGALVIPGLVDAHTHLAFGGWRADEFAQRLRGVPYLDIAEQGGGILSTMRATRAASEDDLLRRCEAFLSEMAQLGVTTVECKSGYGLNVEAESKTLRVYERLRERVPQTLISTFLGAHTIPPEYEDDRAEYIALLTDTLIPTVAENNWAAFCDVFVEQGAFTPDEARTICEAGRAHGLQPKLHADQLSDTGGGALAAELDAASADHLEHVSASSIAAMADADVVAVSLPLATLYLNESPLPARALIEADVPVAVATDFNPGSAPSYHLPFAMTIACTLQRMTPAEVLKGTTAYAAQSIGCLDTLGSLDPGKRADFVLVDALSVNHWMYHLRANAAIATYIGGTRVAS